LENVKREFESLYDRNKSMSYNYIAKKCFAIDDVDDIFQNTWIEIYTALTKRNDPPADPAAFVMLITKRQLTKYYSFIRRVREKISMSFGSSEEYDEHLIDNFTIEDSIVDAQLLDDIWTMINKKPLATQKVLFLYYRRDLTIPEIAEELEMSESTVKMHIYKTLSEIKRRYVKEDIS